MLGRNEIITIIVGIALLLTGGLVATLYGGISDMLVSNFQRAVNSTTDIPNYVTDILAFVPTILQLLGIALLVAVAVHIIRVLMKAPEASVV